MLYCILYYLEEKTLKPVIGINKCNGCGTCATVCPQGVFEMRQLTQDEKSKLNFIGKLKVKKAGDIRPFVVNEDNCIGCGKCVSNCHERTIKLITT